MDTQAFESGQRDVLERIATGASLSELLDRVVELVERQAVGMLCSILLVDNDQGVVRHGSARSLPPEFVRAIDGSPIGPRSGSCGTAAYRREPIVIEDIATHSFWDDYRHLALPWGVRACWSTPIFSSTQTLLGTFAMYYNEPRGPRDVERYWVTRATHLAAIAIERDQSEEAIRFSEVRFRQIVDTCYEGVWLVDTHARTQFVNERMCEMFGYSREEMIGRLAFDFVDERDRERAEHNFRLRPESRATFEYRFRRKDGGELRATLAASPLRDRHGKVVSVLGMVSDLTELRRAEEAERLRGQQIQEQAELLDRAKDAILVRDVDGTVRFWNKGAERLYGWTSTEAVGRKITELIYKDSVAAEHAHQTALRTGEWKGRLTEVSKSGASLIVEDSWTLLRDATGNVKSILSISSDVTEKTRLEQQVLRAQRLESLGTLAGGIAHDFNNILSAVVANVAIALEDLEPRHPARDALVEIETASVRATELVRQILMFSRQQKPKRLFVRLVDIVVEAMKLLKATTPAAIRMQTRFDAKTPQVFADPTQLHQVIVNLVTNAAHAMSESGGALTVAVEPSLLDVPLVEGPMEIPAGPYATLVVADSGEGMDAETLEHIFDPFFTTKEVGKGTGLGLAVVHGIVESHDGAIAVRSQPGKGTTFRIYLPAARVHDVEAPAPPSADVRGEGNRVLCIDDEEAIVKASITFLGRLGYRVTGALDPLQALESFQSDPSRYDAVIVDFSMPGVSGLEFARAALRVRPGLPIVVTSGSLSPEDTRRLADAGVSQVVSKPSTPQELAAALKRALGPAPR